jgi:hypothetical protein
LNLNWASVGMRLLVTVREAGSQLAAIAE